MTGPKRARLDARLVELGLFETRSKAKAAIMAGEVMVDGQVRDKPGALVGAQAKITLKEKPRYVSRGGLKLEAALDGFGISPAGKVCLDVGASTGGFTDCLLQRGADKVFSVDVGKGLLDWKLRNDPRVVVLEKMNARYLEPSIIPEPIGLAVIDVSFISLELIIPAVIPLLVPNADLVPMVKPQFEAGREKVGKGGVVRDPEVQKQCVDKIAAAATGLGFTEKDRLPSPIKGPKGNQEHFIHLVKMCEV